MDHNLGLGVQFGVFDTSRSRVEKTSDVVEIGGGAEGEKEPGSDFITNRDHRKRDGVASEGVRGGKGVVVEFPGEIVNV